MACVLSRAGRAVQHMRNKEVSHLENNGNTGHRLSQRRERNSAPVLKLFLTPTGTGIGVVRLTTLPSADRRSPWHDSAPRGPARVPPPPGSDREGRVPGAGGRDAPIIFCWSCALIRLLPVRRITREYSVYSPYISAYSLNYCPVVQILLCQFLVKMAGSVDP